MHTAESDSAVGCTPQSFLKIWIYRQNRNRILKCFSLFIRGLNGFKSWKKSRSKILWHTPFKRKKVLILNLINNNLVEKYHRNKKPIPVLKGKRANYLIIRIEVSNTYTYSKGVLFTSFKDWSKTSCGNYKLLWDYPFLVFSSLYILQSRKVRYTKMYIYSDVYIFINMFIKYVYKYIFSSVKF